ncbi:hypothetical protein J7L29_07835 [Candidatus Bathyarchaeota archaeon]|nr:hypothetical protein [Candidatus Bathyarchaeota archaeon]
MRIFFNFLIYPKRRTIRVTPEKKSNPRIFKASSKLISMLEALPKKGERSFGKLKQLQGNILRIEEEGR